MNRKALPRRTMLRGALATGGAAMIGLPLLEAMMNSHGTALADGQPFPIRFVTWFFGNGIYPNRFYPAGTGPTWNVSEELTPLMAHKDYISVFQGFNNKSPQKITHHEGMAVFNGYAFVQPPNDPTYQPGTFYSKAGGPTVDQVVADALMGETVIPSIQVGVLKKLSIMDSGTTMHSLSHRATNQPLYPEYNPVNVYNSVFASFTPPDDPNKPVRLAALSAVREDIKAVKLKLGTADIARLDAHLEGISNLEAKINALPPICMKPGVPTETNVDVGGVEPATNVNLVMSDLIAYAFACDITRVASVMVIGGAAEAVLPGISGVHHNNSHAANEPYHTGIVYLMTRLADFLTKMQMADGQTGKTLLDNSTIFVSSDCSTGWDHSVNNQPMLVCGGGGGNLVHPGIYMQGAGRNAMDVTLAAAQSVVPSITTLGAGATSSSNPVVEILV